MNKGTDESKTGTHQVHTFDNGIKVFLRHLIPVQIERYKKTNLHEPEEEHWYLELLGSMNPEHEIIIGDIGSAIGYYSILSKLTIPNCKVVCYEPLLVHREYLLENWALNNLSADDLTIKPFAIYSRRGKLTFESRLYGSRITDSPKKGSLLDRISRRFTKSTSLVDAITLDDEIQNYGHFDLIKIDVQGAELHVLQGASESLRSRKIKNLIIGTHSQAIHRECLKILQDFKYEIIFENIEPADQPDGIVVARALIEEKSVG